MLCSCTSENFEIPRCALAHLRFASLAAASRLITEGRAARAFAIGKCGAYGQAYDYPAESAALAAALNKSSSDCISPCAGRAAGDLIQLVVETSAHDIGRLVMRYCGIEAQGGAAGGNR